MLHLEKLFKTLDSQRDVLNSCLPPKQAVNHFADDIFDFLFPVNCQSKRKASVQYAVLRDQLSQLVSPVTPPTHGWNDQIEYVVEGFCQALPDLYDALMGDAKATLNFDPASESLEEIITTYPGFYAVSIYRAAHNLVMLDVPLLPRMLTEYAHGKTGIDIHPAAKIGCSFFIDHGTGLVIGATSVIGNNVKIYQGVTLGALQVEKALAQTKRHPTIEDNVIIYANATILGGETVIGHDSVIGGNVWLTESLPPYSVVYHQATINVRNKQDRGALNWVI
jgi:serine O-acetyltransferase